MPSMPANDSNISVSDDINTKCLPSINNFASEIKKKKKKKGKKNKNVSIDEDLKDSNVLSNKKSKNLLQANKNATSISCEEENLMPQVKLKSKKKKKKEKHINGSKIDGGKNQAEINSEPESELRIPKQKKKKRSHEELVDDTEKLYHKEADCTSFKKKSKKRKIKQDEIPEIEKPSNVKNSADTSEDCADTLENGADASENGADTSENGANASENGADASENGGDASENRDDEDPTMSSQMSSCSLQVTENDIETSLGGKLTDCKYFSDMQAVLSAPTMTAIESLGFTELTEIQARAIPPLLEGKDLRGTAKTGSGKTLAFLIPAFELLHRLEFKQHHGTGVIILCPTRELAMQTFGVTQILGDRHNMSYGLLIGGANRAAESKALKQGVNVLVACPGRMLDHLKNTSGFLYSNLVCLVLDEADRMLSIGFEEEMKAILKLIPKRRQTMLFSATRNDRTDSLTTIALKVTLVDVDLMAEKSHATVDQLNQYYLVCPVEQRFLVLYTFLKRKKNKKIMVFFSSCGAVKFYQELLAFIDMRVLSIHGKQKQTKRTESFMEFNASDSGALLCTNVAARGWDIPAVDWIIQYDPPEDVNEYIHRVGRTARGGKEGQALLILSEQEVGFVRCLRQKKINVEPIQIGEGKLYNIQGQLEDIMNERYLLALSGRAAFKDYLYSYMKHSQKDIFNYNRLDHAKVAKSFGFDRPPVIDLIAAFKKNKRESYQQRNQKIRRN